MAPKRIDLEDVAKLREGETLWDKIVPGFGIRRQNGHRSGLRAQVPNG